MPKEQPERAAIETTSMETLLTALASSIQSIAPKKEIKEGDPEYVERMRADGLYDDFFGKKVFQNAYEAEARGLSEEVRRRASELKPGVYMIGQGHKRRVEVSVNGTDITLSYPVKGDNLLINQQHWRDFPDLVNQVWEAMHTPVSA